MGLGEAVVSVRSRGISHYGQKQMAGDKLCGHFTDRRGRGREPAQKIQFLRSFLPHVCSPCTSACEEFRWQRFVATAVIVAEEVVLVSMTSDMSNRMF